MFVLIIKNRAMSKKILVVDDNPDILELVKILLERKDYEVETLANGKRTLEIVDSIAIEIPSNPYNESYLLTKRDKMGHNLSNLTFPVNKG